MFDEKCEQYWVESDYLPLNAILDYWCKDNYVCREAKTFAILSACERREIKYDRSDKKPFQDSPMELLQRNILLIHRPSFEQWASKFAGDEKPNVPLSSRSETTYLNIIGALLEFIAGKSPGFEGLNKHPNFSSEAKLIEYFSQYNVPGLSKSTLENKFAEAKKSFLQY